MYTLDLSTHSFLHPATAAGFVEDDVLSAQKRFHIPKQTPFSRCSSHLVVKLVASSCVGRCLIPSSDKRMLLSILKKLDDLLSLIYYSLMSHYYSYANTKLLLHHYYVSLRRQILRIIMFSFITSFLHHQYTLSQTCYCVLIPSHEYIIIEKT